MIIKMSGPIRIDDLHHHPSEMVEKLRALLLAGASARPDPRRKNFYELEFGDDIFYIHVSPTGTVLLLACWRKEPALGPAPRQTYLREAMACC